MRALAIEDSTNADAIYHWRSKMKSLSSKAGGLPLLLGLGLGTLFYLFPTSQALAYCSEGARSCQAGCVMVCYCYRYYGSDRRDCRWITAGTASHCSPCYRPDDEPPSEFQHMTRWKGGAIVGQLVAANLPK